MNSVNDFALLGFLSFKIIRPRMYARHFTLFPAQLEESANVRNERQVRSKNNLYLVS